MERKIILTKDGSHSVSIPEMNVTYHSLHGAIQESVHVFIEAGLNPFLDNLNSEPLSILEIGFGTGLNALLTFAETEKTQHPVHYTSLELYPLETAAATNLNYCEQLNRPDLQPIFEQLHTSEWNKDILISPSFTLHKTNTDLLNFQPLNLKPFNPQPYNLIYFDAFAPTAQPELWTKEVFEKLHSIMTPDGVLVTYCSKSDVRRAMQAAGFTVEKIPGPRGKREMVRARK